MIISYLIIVLEHARQEDQEKLFISFQLSDYIPADNFYKRLNETLDLEFVYRATAKYYGREGQKSIDPVIFMKLMFVSYLENLSSDRKIISISRMRMDIMFFLGYDLDEELPWHSTLSRTRQLYGMELFENLFKKVLKLYIDKGMVSGKRKAICIAEKDLDMMRLRQMKTQAELATLQSDPSPFSITP